MRLTAIRAVAGGAGGGERGGAHQGAGRRQRSGASGRPARSEWPGCGGGARAAGVAQGAGRSSTGVPDGGGASPGWHRTPAKEAVPALRQAPRIAMRMCVERSRMPGEDRFGSLELGRVKPHPGERRGSRAATTSRRQAMERDEGGAFGPFGAGGRDGTDGKRRRSGPPHPARRPHHDTPCRSANAIHPAHADHRFRSALVVLPAGPVRGRHFPAAARRSAHRPADASELILWPLSCRSRVRPRRPRRR